MRMRRANYKIPKPKHKKLMELLIDDGKNFNEFVNKAIDLYLEGEFTPFEDEIESEQNGAESSEEAAEEDNDEEEEEQEVE